MFKMASYQLHGCHLCTSGARRIRDLDKLITSFYPGRLTTTPTPLNLTRRSVETDDTRIDASNTNVSFNHLCSPVAPITGPWKCVVYRDIRLLKAHSNSGRFSSNCVGDAAPKHSIGCGFVLTIIRGRHLRNVYT